MKQTIYILTFTFFLLSCNNNVTEKKADTDSIDTLRTSLTNQEKQDIYIKDKSQYDQSFIEGLSNVNGPIKLIDNFIIANTTLSIITGTDTTYFPEDLELDKKITFNTVKDNNRFLLEITRTNLTNLNYEFQLIDNNNNTIFHKSGKAILDPGFFLVQEGDIDTEMGDFRSVGYLDKTNDCKFQVKIGIGKDGNGKQRAKLEYICKDINKKRIDLDECPVLRTE